MRSLLSLSLSLALALSLSLSLFLSLSLIHWPWVEVSFVRLASALCSRCTHSLTRSESPGRSLTHSLTHSLARNAVSESRNGLTPLAKSSSGPSRGRGKRATDLLHIPDCSRSTPRQGQSPWMCCIPAHEAYTRCIVPICTCCMRWANSLRALHTQ